MTDETTTAEAPKKKGPKPNPFAAYERARNKADAARRSYEKVQRLAERLHDAEREEQEAYEALQQALASVTPPAADDAE